MTQRVSDLTIEELEKIVENTVRHTVEEELEARTSPQYLDAMREAREEYRRGAVTKLSDLRAE